MKRDFNKYINHLTEEELREELERLYGRFPVLREYYRMELGDPKVVIDKYKDALRKVFFPARGRGKRGRSQSRKIIKKFAEVSIHPKDLVELHFYRAELMAEYLGARRVDSEAYHDSTVKAFQEACELAEREVLLDYFAEGARLLAELFERERRDHRYSFYPTYRQYWDGRPE
ncbi:hypothetical protein GGR26_000316 [Lewinella marina]|uniref:Uncharacterized protein n=1 Tax=Neolewinella marina TaxID=438751 RepID=A0A2G0CJX9_9BACT|nr:DUF6155 family protein [Neolewinella marina]NJB84571.1 hypothetical protein [Neolewinella marina]PHL00248.1 hypothetical protein CGL56_04210 [Neolewinella marina]